MVFGDDIGECSNLLLLKKSKKYPECQECCIEKRIEYFIMDIEIAHDIRVNA